MQAYANVRAAVRGQPRCRLRDARAAQRDVLDQPRRPVAVRRDRSRRFAGMQGVERSRTSCSYLDQIFSSLNAATYIAIGIAALMLVAAVLLIATTIRLSAYSRRRELGIMRLVGASNRFIQTPFILEGVFAALIGSLLGGCGGVRRCVQFFVQGISANGSCLSTSWVRHRCADRRADPARHGGAARRVLGRLRDHALAARSRRRYAVSVD